MRVEKNHALLAEVNGLRIDVNPTYMPPRQVPQENTLNHFSLPWPHALHHMTVTTKW